MRRLMKRYALAAAYPLMFTIEIFEMLAKTFSEAWKNRDRGRQLVAEEVTKQVYFTAAQAFWIVTLFAAITGLGVGFEISTLLKSVGNPALVNKVLFTLSVREIAPLATAIIVLGRSGCAVAVELATLVYNEELNTYKALGISKYRLLIYPRLIGISAATLVLSVYFVAICIMSGALLVYLDAGVPFPIYVTRMLSEGTQRDVILFVARNLLSGVAIAAVCSIAGLSVRQSLTEIPRAASRAMVHSLFVLIALSGIMAVFTYAI